MTDLEQAYNERLKELEAENKNLRDLIRVLISTRESIDNRWKRLRDVEAGT